MKLEYFYVKGFRRITEAKIICGDATFLIGENNIGKSSILKAMYTFFSEEEKLSDEDFFKVEEPSHQAEEIVMEAKFSDLPEAAVNWRGFKGRLIKENINGQETTCIYYKKTFTPSAKVKREMKSFDKAVKAEYAQCKTINDFVAVSAVLESAMSEAFGNELDKTKAIPAKEKDKLELISDLWTVDEAQSNWVNNPGGIEGNISVKLPKFLLIPAENKQEEINNKTGALQKMMKDLFEEVRDSSENYKQAQEYLDKLAQELNPNDEEKEFGKMLVDINKIVGDVFTNTKIHITTNLSDPGSSIVPKFDIEMSSNVKTQPERQGMGSIRSTVFALLRYREKFVERKRAAGTEIRPLIIGFEEPEMYLHPNAAALMRDKIYELATSSNSKIICTTHSPYMIDLSKKIDEANYPKQVLNLFRLEHNAVLGTDTCNVTPFNTTEAYKELQEDERQYVKFLLKIDDHIAKVFFCKKILIVEGDTEEILLKETIERLPLEKRKLFQSNYQIVKARGKATIISLVKYLTALALSPYVIHDKDTEEGATKFNAPILAALAMDEGKRYMVENTIEDILGYTEPASEKPFKAYEYIKNNWGADWQGVHEQWRKIFEDHIAPDLFVQAIDPRAN